MAVKSVAEWLGELKIYNKRITRLESEIKKTDLFIVKPKAFVDEEEMQRQMDEAKSKITSYKKLISNRSVIKEALMIFNATTKITVGDIEMTIASALTKYSDMMTKGKGGFIEDKLIKSMNEKQKAVQELERKQADELRRYESELNSSNKQIGKATLEERLLSKKEELKPVLKTAFDLEKEYQELCENEEHFLEEVNIQINIANVKHELDINLD